MFRISGKKNITSFQFFIKFIVDINSIKNDW